MAYSSIFVVVQYTENLASKVAPRNIERRSNVVLFHYDDKTLTTPAGCAVKGCNRSSETCRTVRWFSAVAVDAMTVGVVRLVCAWVDCKNPEAPAASAAMVYWVVSSSRNLGSTHVCVVYGIRMR